jgi:hypothetical protein
MSDPPVITRYGRYVRKRVSEGDGTELAGLSYGLAVAVPQAWTLGISATRRAPLRAEPRPISSQMRMLVDWRTEGLGLKACATLAAPPLGDLIRPLADGRDPVERVICPIELVGLPARRGA